ncbi:MAG TPA: MMPL family transporter [Candidatus Acidoferrales bacterium]|nr:MMPL family transporter [Candidatus Acidoferrales bacterium]
MSSFLKRWWWALLLVAVGLGLWRLRFDVDILDLLPPDEPAVQGLKLYQQHFANARELIITVRAPDANQAERLAGELAERLQQQTNLVAEVTWQAPWNEHPEQLGELLGWLWFNQPPESFGALTNRLAPDRLKSTLEQTKEALATSMSPMDLARREYDPFDLLAMPALTNLAGFSIDQSQQMFASADGKFRLLYVESAVDLDSYRSCESWLKSIQAIVGAPASLPGSTGTNGLETRRQDAGVPGTNGVLVRYTGRPVFVEEIATSMQRDMSHSVGITSTVIALLFWLTHRRWRPMLWLLALLMLILGATLALGGLVLGTVSVVSLGFAAVLLGLAVDYAVVHYQEALAHPQMTVPEIRRTIAPSILWAAITTMSAFLVLNLGGLPGLGQLGTLVAIGIALSALVMVMIYLPPLFPERRKPRPDQPPFRWWNYFVAPQPGAPASLPAGSQPNAESRRLDAGTPGKMVAPWLLTGLIVVVAGAVLCFRQPGLDRTGNALQPQHGEAQTALDEMTVQLGLPPQPLWVIISGQNESEVYQRLTNADASLDAAVSNQVIGRYLLPTALWPRLEYQAANRTTATILGTKGPLLDKAALAEGFNSNALVLTGELVQTWARAGESTNGFWPTNHVSQWLLKRFITRTPDEWLVMGLVYPATNRVESTALAGLSKQLAMNGALLSSWELLGNATLKRVQSRMLVVVMPTVALVVLSLWFAFRRATEILLGATVLCLSGLCLLAIMTVSGWTWNLMNLMALPLMLGTGVDYTIFMQLALRRHGGDLVIVRRSVGRALMLCGGTAVAGFGSLGLSSNPGMASLGRVCAVGIGANMLISVFLLPTWWKLFGSNFKVPASKFKNGEAKSPNPQSPTLNPFSFYRAGLWRLGLVLVRILPIGLVKGFAVIMAGLYWRFQRERCEVVVQNLLPLLAGDHEAAEVTARRLHRKFAAKLVDLWRVESGVPVQNWLTNEGELEIIRAARQRGHGTLFITLHLGNWEHGGLLLTQLGIRLTILTQAEPDDGLTGLRIEARRRLGVGTLVIGQDDFAFVEVIKQLQAGADLAISLDRPPDRGGVPIEFFGHSFEASLAAAELARASGCALIGVTIVRRPNGYAVKVLPEFTYDRKALGNRDARRELTQQILRAFEPEIRKDIEQWYQFTPIWPKNR